jgi:hypothetical protein
MQLVYQLVNIRRQNELRGSCDLPHQGPFTHVKHFTCVVPNAPPAVLLLCILVFTNIFPRSAVQRTNAGHPVGQTRIITPVVAVRLSSTRTIVNITLAPTPTSLATLAKVYQQSKWLIAADGAVLVLSQGCVSLLQR